MNIALWILQILLSLHTAIGAVWKYSNSEVEVPSLSAIPHPLWLGLGVVELLCAVALVFPLINRAVASSAPIGALVIAAEMLMFCALHVASGKGSTGELVYWAVVASLCGVVAYGRGVLLTR